MIPHPKKLIGLDILRGLACLTVWVSHLRIATEYFNDPKYDALQIIIAWGREAVVIFFVLSGIVINMASHNRTDRLQYFKKRFLRIYPIFFVVLVICYASDYFIFHNLFNASNVFGNVFLQGMWPKFIVPTLPYNTASWSITCEAFFYVVFGLFYTSNRVRVAWIWLGLSIASIIFRLNHDYHLGVIYQFLILMNNSFPWLLGYLIYEYRDRLYANAQTAVCGVLMVPLVTRLNMVPIGFRQTSYYVEALYLVPLFVYILRKYRVNQTNGAPFAVRHIYFLPIYAVNIWLLWQYSDSLRISKLLYSVIPLISLALYLGFVKSLFRWVYTKLKHTILFFADISYPLYLVHMPTMYLVYHFLPTQKLIGVVLIIIIAITVAYLFEVYLFRKLSAWTNTTGRETRVEETII